MTGRPVSIFYISYFRGGENNKLIIYIKLNSIQFEWAYFPRFWNHALDANVFKLVGHTLFSVGTAYCWRTSVGNINFFKLAGRNEFGSVEINQTN